MIIYNLIKEDKTMIYHSHNVYTILMILGSILLDNIYLSFIILILFIAVITREYFGVCLFSIHKPKTDNGTLTIMVLMVIIILRILLQKQFKNLLKF